MASFSTWVPTETLDFVDIPLHVLLLHFDPSKGFEKQNLKSLSKIK